MLDNEHLFTNIGIDSAGFYAPKYYISLDELAKHRNIDPNKFKKGLLSREMRLPDVNEDIISMGLKAAYNALMKGNISPRSIDALFCGTETITYSVKSVSNIFAELLGISPNSMTQDIYNACAGGTLAIINALALIEKEVIKRALIIIADISTYQMGTPSEPTQGSGAVALILSKNPRIAKFSKKFGKISGNINDFWRPVNQVNAQVFGHYSVDSYLNFQMQAYDDLIKSIGDFHADFYVFHAPYAKLPIKIMRQIIQKRWISHIDNLPRIKRPFFKSTILQKLDFFLHDVTALPEYIYLKLREKDINLPRLELISHYFIDTLKTKVLPQLRIPSHFGNMYNASIWAQIIYILENYGHINDTIYFGSYGSGATCLSGLLKVCHNFRSVVNKPPKIEDFIKIKEKRSVHDYELIKMGNFQTKIMLGKIKEHEKNKNRGFRLCLCDEGCLIPNIRGLDHCPMGHSGFHEIFFPLFAVLISDPIKMENHGDLRYLNEGLVRISGNVKKGSLLEYELRRVDSRNNSNQSGYGLLNWSPLYVPVSKIY
ncbi:MAG: hydroxymethylglutaryl-CoA synthase family protein [Promethearchaeota archaeon]